MMSSIPSVNLEDFISDDKNRKEKFIKEIGSAFENIGFVALSGHFCPISWLTSWEILMRLEGKPIKCWKKRQNMFYEHLPCIWILKKPILTIILKMEIPFYDQYITPQLNKNLKMPLGPRPMGISI